MRMNSEIKVKWLEALRSGDYQQGTESLKKKELDTDGNPTNVVRHCCLGVLCDLAVAAGVVESHQKESSWEYGWEYVGELPPEEVAEWAGIEVDGDPSVMHPTTQERTTLASLNDNGYSFESIAEIIEKQL